MVSGEQSDAISKCEVLNKPGKPGLTIDQVKWLSSELLQVNKKKSAVLQKRRGTSNAAFRRTCVPRNRASTLWSQHTATVVVERVGYAIYNKWPNDSIKGCWSGTLVQHFERANER